ncbi:hypothetical protein BDN72DRAFT_905043 [Pluteus cervinus]|uniref:Uncharacterized protein n=1 Tax=Pluteus cervinus TaxID=181527 RepID=A0ACD3A3E5_9AGAR|nr:hypothetical protein BDN72DRAFT_905043 [Pluteus cervinus]
MNALPFEVLSEVLSHIDLHIDLVNLACVSRSLCAIIIPFHTEYRVIQTASSVPTSPVWRHLSARKDLAKNVRKIYFGYGTQRFPTTLTSNLAHSQSEITSRADCALEHARTVASALRNMYNLTSFHWEPHTQVVNLEYRNLILVALSQNPSLKELILPGAYSYQDNGATSTTDEELIWNLPDLTTLQFANLQSALNNTTRSLMFPWYSSSLTIQSLHVDEPTLAQYHSTLELPSLELLVIEYCKLDPLGPTGPRITLDICQFLQNHPSIQDLLWAPRNSVAFPSDGRQDLLPNLKTLRTSGEFVYMLENAHASRIQNSRGPKTLQLEAIHAGLSVEELLKLTFIDKTTLQGFKVTTFEDKSSLILMAKAFPSMEWLLLPYEWNRPITWELGGPFAWDDYIQTVSQFPNLTRLDGSSPYALLNWDPIKIQRGILDLARLCPKLNEMGPYICAEPRSKEPRVYIFREELSTTPATVWYEVREGFTGRVRYDSRDGSTPNGNIRLLGTPHSPLQSKGAGITNWFTRLAQSGRVILQRGR